MNGTRQSFERLTGELLNKLSREILRKVTSDLNAKTQISIDTLVRNLFERTADIGFLAADDAIAGHLSQNCPDRASLEQRFEEYVAKYSVYSDIILFNAEHRISARLTNQSFQGSSHPLLEEARTTSAPYVEYFGETDFLPPGKNLIYAFRVEDGAENPIGVLALVFRLENEAEGIFRNLIGFQDACILASFDEKGRVVSTSSPVHLPAGTELDERMRSAQGGVVRFCGREYLAVACPAHAYQGYPGPGWRGLGLLPVEYAFERDDTELLEHIDPCLLEAVAEQSRLFSDALREIPRQAEAIQNDLSRSVWNGSVRQTSGSSPNFAFAKTLLWEISRTGRRTQATFEQSIRNLRETVVAALLQGGVVRSALAIDLMDRNLYERANDCRWWAQNATFRRVLSLPSPGAEDISQCSAILSRINSLYTVYHNLVIFDSSGTVLATSNPERAGLIGERLGEEWIARCLELDSPQSYVRSEFRETQLYGGSPTYVFAAAILNQDGSAALGGIGIAFDGRPQFEAMLNDTLPNDESGQPVAGAEAFFIDENGTVRASTAEAFPVGSHLPLTSDQGSAVQSGRWADIRIIDGAYYAIGVVSSSGYREYKTSDGHVDHVLAVSAFPLGRAENIILSSSPGHVDSDPRQERSRQTGDGADRIEIASFHIGQQWLGVLADSVVEAIEARDLSPVHGSRSELIAGICMYRGRAISVIDLTPLLASPPPSGRLRQIIVLKSHEKICMGILVEALGEIPEIPPGSIQRIGQAMAAGNSIFVGAVTGLGSSTDRNRILSIIDPGRLCQRMSCNCKENSPN
ncbi:chemotaxis protein CheW [Niveibacterium terrae]|uniref:chemotaxis protein CheW n=1 Tax=Niveibacterium terrae TaxID=3373598 RepID=UPI003A8FF94D